MMLKKLLPFFISLFFITGWAVVSAQDQTTIDSLETELKTAEQDTARMHIMCELSWYYKGSDMDKAFSYAREAIVLAESKHNTYYIAKSHSYLGSCYYNEGEFKDAVEQYNFAYNLYNELKERKMAANCLANLCNIYAVEGDYSKSIEIGLATLTVLEELKDTLSVCKLMVNLGANYQELNNMERAKEYYNTALPYLYANNEKEFVGMCYNNIGGYYIEQHNADEAIKYFKLACAIYTETGDKRGLSKSYFSMGIAFDSRGTYDKAFEYYFIALKTAEELKDKDWMSAYMNSIGLLYSKTGNYIKALEYLNKSLKLADELHSNWAILASSKGLSEAYFRMAEEARESVNRIDYYKKAYHYFEQYASIKDSVLNEETTKQIEEMNTKYRTGKKEKEIAIQKAELEKKEIEIKKQNIQKIAFASGFALVLVLAFVIFRSYRQKQKHNVVLTSQKTEIENKNTALEQAHIAIVGQKKVIEEKNKDILDSIRYAKRIQQAILPPVSLIKQYLPQSFVMYKPKDIVAGDFYWMEVVEEKVISNQYSVIGKKPTTDYSEESGVADRPPITIFIAACDCTGHGVPGALVSVVCNNALNRAVKEFGLLSPSKILDKVNELVDETFSKSETEIQDGMDIALCRIDPDRKILEFSGANNSAYLIRNGAITELEADKQPVGKFLNRKSFSNHSFNLCSGDTIYVFTDGYADQFGGPKGKKFKYSQFEQLLLSLQSEHLESQKPKLEEAIEKWRGEHDQVDDICVIGVRV